MIHIWWCLLLAAGSLAAQEWRPLFDGKTFNGWRGPKGAEVSSDIWKIEDGALRTVPTDYGRDLFTAESFNDFELALEWKISPGGNSGIFYNILDAPKPPLHKRWWYLAVQKWTGWHAGGLLVIALFWMKSRPRGRNVALAALGIAVLSALYGTWHLWGRYQQGVVYAAMGLEMQVLDDERHPDAKVGPTRRAGALYDQLAPSKPMAKPAGEWNEARLLVRGNHVEHWLNGEKIVEFEIGSPEFNQLCAKSKFQEICPAWGQKRISPIALQHHHDAVWYRNIRVRTM